MIFVTGPLFSGKEAFARSLGLEGPLIRDVQDLAAREEDLPALADRLARDYTLVLATEVGGGVVPADPQQRRAREAAGRLSCLLARRAQTVVRVFCGLPMILKGELDV